MDYKFLCDAQGENWWLGAVIEGVNMPINSVGEEYTFDGTINSTYNQLCTLLISDKGKYIFAEGGCHVTIGNGAVRLSEANGIVDFCEGYGSLKEAYHAAANKHFHHSSKAVPPILLLSPQYCSWVEMLRSIDQVKVIEYVQSVKEAGLPEGCFILDDGWMKDYGDWEFPEEKFPDPARMCEEMHRLGFKVILWLAPFVNQSAQSYAQLEKQGALVKNPDGTTAIRTWWNGDSAVLDLTNPYAWNWLKARLDTLIQKFGVDGFKFDAGDAFYYEKDDITYLPTTPNGQSVLWAKFAAQYEYSELRACVDMAGYPIVQRLCDKDSTWDETKGLGSLIPNMIQAGLAGYTYCCPDMVGGGQESDFGEGKEHDCELFIRSCQCVALMPMMQFSYAIWRHYNCESVKKTVYDCAVLRKKYKEYFESLLEEARVTCAPILRNMEYSYPHQGMENVKEQFMLGPDLLVAPVIQKGNITKRVILPAGDEWIYIPTGVRYKGGQTVEVSAPIEVLPYFERVK